MSKELRNQLERNLASLDRMEGEEAEQQRQAIQSKLAELEDTGDDEPGEADPWEGVHITAAARARAEELEMTPEDFKRRRATGKGGFVVGDVERIHAAIDKEDTDGDD